MVIVVGVTEATMVQMVVIEADVIVIGRTTTQLDMHRLPILTLLSSGNANLLQRLVVRVC